MKQINYWAFLQKQKLIPFFGVLSDWLACFPALPWPCAISTVARVQQHCCQYYANCNAEYNWAFFLFAFPFFNCGDFCSDVLSCWTAVGASQLISLQMLPTLGSSDGRSCCPWSLGCLSDWPNPLLVLLEQLVPMWHWGDTADEVKQLARVWSSKHRHTLPTDKKGGWDRAVQNKSVWETQDMERWQWDKEWDREWVRQIDPLIMDRPLEMPNGERSLQA